MLINISLVIELLSVIIDENTGFDAKYNPAMKTITAIKGIENRRYLCDANMHFRYSDIVLIIQLVLGYW